jgi:Yip1 domain
MNRFRRMKASDYFFKTTFKPEENFSILRDDPNKDKIGYGTFFMSIGFQIGIKLLSLILIMGYYGGIMGEFLSSLIVSILVFNVLFLVFTHVAINQAAEGKHADWQLVMGLVGSSSLPIVMASVLSSFLWSGGQLFGLLGSIGAGVILGLGAHILMGIKKESAVIVGPILVLIVHYVSGFINQFLFNVYY